MIFFGAKTLFRETINRAISNELILGFGALVTAFCAGIATHHAFVQREVRVQDQIDDAEALNARIKENIELLRTYENRYEELLSRPTQGGEETNTGLERTLPYIPEDYGDPSVPGVRAEILMGPVIGLPEDGDAAGRVEGSPASGPSPNNESVPTNTTIESKYSGIKKFIAEILIAIGIAVVATVLQIILIKMPIRIVMRK